MRVADQLIKIIKETPEQCSCDRFRFKVGDAKLWISNGWFFFRFSDCNYPNDALSTIDKWRLWKAYQWWVVNADVSAFKSVR